jgi:calcium-dependent protein kinase
VVVFILLMGYMPFPGESVGKIEHRIKIGDIYIKEEPWSCLSECAREFVLTLLTVDPCKRLSAPEALEHPWIVSGGGGAAVAQPCRDSVIGCLTQFAAASKFKRACLSMMAWSLTNDERAQVRAAFLAMDKDNTGVIRLHELKQVLQDKVDIADEDVQRIFNSLDSSCDDMIHYTDFLSAMVASRLQMHEGLLRDSFKRFDVDNSGVITEANLRQILGECCSAGEVEKLVREADITGDGQISFEEFVNYLQDAPECHAEAAERIIETEQRRQSCIVTDGVDGATGGHWAPPPPAGQAWGPPQPERQTKRSLTCVLS